MEFGGEVFKTTERGLTAGQWFICIGFSLITFAANFLIKLIPVHNMIQKLLDNKKKSNKIANIDDLIGEEKDNNYVIYQRSEDGNIANNRNSKNSNNGRYVKESRMEII